MAQLKDLLVSGKSRFIGDIISNKIQLNILNAPTVSGGTTYSAGSSGQVLVSGGSSGSIWWKTLGAASDKNILDRTSATAFSSTGTDLLVTERTIYYGLPTINNSHNYTSSTTIYAPTAGGTANTHALVGNGETSAPKWVNIGPTLATSTAATGSAGQKLKVTVLEQDSSEVELTKAATNAYGVTKLSSDVSNSTELAATPAGVGAAITNALADNGTIKNAINVAVNGTQNKITYFTATHEVGDSNITYDSNPDPNDQSKYGQILLGKDPSDPKHAATKAYVDSKFVLYQGEVVS